MKLEPVQCKYVSHETLTDEEHRQYHVSRPCHENATVFLRLPEFQNKTRAYCKCHAKRVGVPWVSQEKITHKEYLVAEVMTT